MKGVDHETMAKNCADNRHQGMPNSPRKEEGRA